MEHMKRLAIGDRLPQILDLPPPPGVGPDPLVVDDDLPGMTVERQGVDHLRYVRDLAPE
jgi:hypothetical protein